MYYEPQLQFVRDLLKGMHISTHIVTDPSVNISSEIDLGLREMLFSTTNYIDILHNSMNDAKENTIYRFFDEYYCNYIFMRLPGDDSFFYIGPYLPNPPEEDYIQNKSDALCLNDEMYQRMLKYYYSLPVVEDETLLFTIANTLGNTFWGSDDNYSVEYIDYMIPDSLQPIQASPLYNHEQETGPGLSILETNYANEKYLMDAVSQGKLHKITALASSVYNNGTEQRLSDSLRNRKNYLIILNTLLRKAAEAGGVHPLHIDRMSSSFARKIENVHSIQYSLVLQGDMMREYCLLVKKHSLNKYSSFVGKAITIIAYDLTADLSLKSISEQLSVNPTYLSALFRKEMDCTLTDYVTKKRMEHAISLLIKTDKSINSIAEDCGISDTNYFIKLFKKFTRLTPTQYREKFGKSRSSS